MYVVLFLLILSCLKIKFCNFVILKGKEFIWCVIVEKLKLNLWSLLVIFSVLFVVVGYKKCFVFFIILLYRIFVVFVDNNKL